jgi:hypothetical protein
MPDAYMVEAIPDARGIHRNIYKIAPIPDGGVACQVLVRQIKWQPGVTEIIREEELLAA